MRVAVLLIVLVALTSCGNGPDNGRNTDFFVWRGVPYGAQFGSWGRTLSEGDLGPQQFTVSAQVISSKVGVKERQAGVLPAGTSVFALKAYATTFRLAAKVDGAIRLYEALPHAGLRVGADLLDIEGRVIAIEFGPAENALFTRVERPDRIARLVHLISVASIDMSAPWGTPAGGLPAVQLRFELSDGTVTSRSLDRNRGRFADVLSVGDEFSRTVEGILAAQWCQPGMLTGC